MRMSILLITLSPRISRTMADTEKMFDGWIYGWMVEITQKQLEMWKIYLNVYIYIKKKTSLDWVTACLVLLILIHFLRNSLRFCVYEKFTKNTHCIPGLK